MSERMDRLDEALAICRAMFDEERATFSGHHYRIDGALNSPRPLQKGGPPILVGGGGERRTIPIAARYADFTHWGALGLGVLNHKSEVLARQCEAIGRDPDEIRRLIIEAALQSSCGQATVRLRSRRGPPKDLTEEHGTTSAGRKQDQLAS